ncbi:SMC-Scp complex subunit ScpB [Synergistaceae bacterium OttesenSCG-928-D05]|nr:SMC-Scp complex subunit ScpB [Synergistaceae bacterium OttesenSCG-928-D05]
MERLDEKTNVMGLLERQVEAMLFVSPQPVATQEIATHLGVSTKRVEEAVRTLKEVYAKDHGLTVLFEAGGWMLATAPDLGDVVESFANTVSLQRVRLSRAALETLSVIAYNQPVTRSEIEEIRSVRCDRVVDTLLKHGLVRVAGRKKSVGSPLLFRTTERFLEIFGLASISSLPTLEELRESGEDIHDAFSALGVDEQEGEDV